MIQEFFHLALWCSGACQRWFTKKCTGITRGKFNVMKLRTCSVIFCQACKLKMTATKPKETVEPEHQAIQQSAQSNAEKYKEVR
jgi:hypothetical protein